MSHKIAGIDVYKKLLVVVIADAATPDIALQSRRFGTGSGELRQLSAWLSQYGVVEAVMESTAQYWKPVWMELRTRLRVCWKRGASNCLLLGASGRRILRAMARGETSPEALAALGYGDRLN